MNRWLRACGFLSLISAPLHAQDTTAGALALVGATVIDVRTGDSLPNMTVQVRGNRITAVAASHEITTPADAQVVDARGKYLLPGLIETHAHHGMQWWRQPADSLEYLAWIVASGVTTTRDALWAGGEERAIALRQAQRTGRILSPRLYVSALVDSVAMKRLETRTVGETVQRFKEMGVDAIKIRSESPDFRLQVIREAVAAGLPVYGHTDDFTMEAVRAGVSGVVHVASLGFRAGEPDLEGLDPRRAGAVWYHYKLSGWLDADTAEREALIDSMVAHGTWLEPTLLFNYLPLLGDDYDATAIRRYQPWYGSDVLPFTPQERDTALAALRRVDAFVRRFYEAGGLVIAGTDHVPLPPLGVTEEMRRLVEAGLPPLAALQAATINAATALHMTEEIGTVEEGKLADLLVLDRNPLEDIRNVREVHAVVANGRLLERQALDALLEREAAPIPDK